MTDRAHSDDLTAGRSGHAGAPAGGPEGGDVGGDYAAMLERGQPARRSLLKRMLPRSLFGRALMIIVTPVVLVQAISAFVFIERHYDETTERLAEGLAGQIAATVALMSDERVGLDRNAAFNLASRTMWLSLSFEPDAGLPEDVPPPQNTILDARLIRALNERLPYPFAVDTHTLPEDVRIWVETETGVLRVLVSRKRIFSSTTYLVYFWAVGTAILLVAVALVFMRNQVRPIRRLAVAAERFGKGQDVPAFKPEGATEVRQASAAFIQMRERIKRQINQRTEMLAGVSHDLRTPLTRMKLQLAMLGDTPEAHSLQEDVTQMERMIEDYLAFARGEGTETPAPTKLGELVGEVVAKARQDGDRVRLQVDREVELPLRREVMRRAIANLVSNGLRHGTQVTVRVGRRRHLAEVTVDDDGPGIPRDKREEVFRPFHRLDASRNPRTGGTGLGLTIARDVVRGHGGDLILEDAPDGGLRAKLLLPV